MIGVVVGVVAGTGMPAHARDFCFDAHGLVLVARSFKPAGAGKCKVWKGGYTPGGAVVNGSACTSTDGTTLRVGYGLLDTSGPVSEVGQLDLPLPALAGGTAKFLACASAGCSAGSGTAAGAPCDPVTPPLP